MPTSWRFLYQEYIDGFKKILPTFQTGTSYKVGDNNYKAHPNPNMNVSFSFKITFHSIQRPLSKIGKLIKKEIGDVSWYKIILEWTNMSRSTTIAVLPGPYYIMRNGDNINEHNFFIMDPNKKHYFRRNVSFSISLIQLLMSPIEDLPLFIGKDLGKKNLTLLENLLKGDN